MTQATGIAGTWDGRLRTPVGSIDAVYTFVAVGADGELAGTDPAAARALYAKARPSYHPIAVESPDRLLGKP